MSDLLNSTEFIIGGTGTGKSYLASMFMKQSYDKKERLIYTNVNLKNGFNDYIKHFDKDDLYEFAKSELELYKKFERLSKEHNDKQEDKEDDIYLLSDELKNVDNTNEIDADDDISKYHGNYDDYLKASGLLDKFGGSMIVWDECQDDLVDELGKAYFDVVWGRFFSYRRHFGIHLIMITQDLDLIHRKYKKHGNKFFFGQNSARRYFSKMLRYEVYYKSQEFKKYHIETKNILMKKEIQDFYDTGEKNVGKSVFTKLLFIPVIFIFLIYFGYKAFDSKYSNDSQTIHSPEHNLSIANQQSIMLKDDSEEYLREESEHLIFFNCNLENCTMKNSSFTVPLRKMQTFSTAVNMEILFSSKINDYYSLVVVSANESLYNDLMSFNLEKRGDTHDKGKMDFNAPISFTK